MDKDKAEAAAYAVEIELLTRARLNLAQFAPYSEALDSELARRLGVLLDVDDA